MRKFLKRRRGMGLPATICIVLVSLIIVAVIFQITTRFNRDMMQSRMVYSDQVVATSYIEKAKALIITKAKLERAAPHPLADWVNEPEGVIDELDDLLIYYGAAKDKNNDDLYLTDVKEGIRQVSLRVYDLTYSPKNSLKSTITSDDKEMLPAPIPLIAMAGGTSSSSNTGTWTVVGEDNATDRQNANDDSNRPPVDLNALGAYLIRVIINDKDGKPVRTTEESFFYVLETTSP